MSYQRKADLDYQIDTYQGGVQELHPRITIQNLIRRIKFLKTKQTDQAFLHPTKIKIMDDTIAMIKEQTNIRDAYAIFLRSFTWHPNATSPVEISFEKEYRMVCGDEMVDTYCPEIYARNRNDDEFNVADIIFGRPLNRLNPKEGKEVLSPIPTVTPGTPRQTLEEICNDRAQEIGAIGKDVYVLWSGGIDSTLALHSLNNNNVSFHIIMDNDTIMEYPDLADQITGEEWPNCAGIVFNPKPDKYKEILDNPGIILISGGQGDEIFGGEPNCAGELKNADQQYDYYVPSYAIEGTDPYIKQLLSPLYGEDVLQDMTVCEWRWAINFIYRYQQIQISSAYMLGMNMLRKEGKADALHFYDTDAFQIWSIQNYRSLCGDGEDKQVAKDLIYKYDGNEWFHKDKTKVCSMKKTRYRSGRDYIGTGGAVGTDVGVLRQVGPGELAQGTHSSYSDSILITGGDYTRLLKPGVLINALDRAGDN